MSQLVGVDYGPIERVAQEHANGCVPAALAMILGLSYGEAIAIIDAQDTNAHDGDWDANGVDYHAMMHALGARGWFWQLRYKAWTPEGEWPPEPFAPVHYASVVQAATGHAHAVVMLATGEVLDPLREGTFSLTDWPEVYHVIGLVRP